jgi:hypothetical protein
MDINQLEVSLFILAPMACISAIVFIFSLVNPLIIIPVMILLHTLLFYSLLNLF